MSTTGVYGGDREIVDNQINEVEEEIFQRSGLVGVDRFHRWLYCRNLHNLQVAISGIHKTP